MIFDAIKSLRPAAEFVLNGDSYDGLEWLDESQTKPTEEEVNAEILRLQAEYDVKDYQRKRALEYPSIVDQLDLLYHEGYEGWKAAIQSVKDKYPKGAK